VTLADKGVVRAIHGSSPEDVWAVGERSDSIQKGLALHYDAEASLSTRAGADTYEVRIVMPYVKGGGS
jgi:hypothetical protein